MNRIGFLGSVRTDLMRDQSAFFRHLIRYSLWTGTMPDAIEHSGQVSTSEFDSPARSSA